MQEPRKVRKSSLSPEELAAREAKRKLKKIEKDRRYRLRLKSERLGRDDKRQLLEDKIAAQQVIIQRQGQQLVELYAQLKKK